VEWSKRLAAVAVVLGWAAAVEAAPVPVSGLMSVFAPDGTVVASDTVAGDLDVAAATIHLLGSPVGFVTPVHDGALLGEGSHVVTTQLGNNVSVTVEPGQLGAHILVGTVVGDFLGPSVDEVNVWDVTTGPGGTTYTSTDVDGDGIPGMAMVDGKFTGFTASFDLTTVPEPMSGALVGGAVGLLAWRRRVECRVGAGHARDPALHLRHRAKFIGGMAPSYPRHTGRRTSAGAGHARDSR